jgi:hypothetical protein
MRRWVALVGLMLVVAGACGGGSGDAGGPTATSSPRTSSSTSPSSTSSTTTTTSSTTTTTTEATAGSTSSTTTTPTSVPADEEPVAFNDPLDFFRSTEAACIEHSARVGNTAPEPERFSGARVVDLVAFRVWLVEDGMGEQVVVDLEGGVVYSIDGPEAPLPIIYSFGCPETLYLGTHWD